MNLLINPSSMVQMGYTPPPLGLLFLAAMDKDTQVIDMALDPNYPIKEYIETNKPVVVGVPIYTAGRKESFRLLDMAKMNGAVTIAGGPHARLMFTMSWKPEEKYRYIDAYAFNDGEYAWRDLCQKANEITDIHERRWAFGSGGGRVGATNIYSGRVQNLDDLPLPAYDKISFWKYPSRVGTVAYHRGNDLGITPRYSIVFGRGCDGSCTFCSTWWVHGPYHHHGVGWMYKHLKQLDEMGAKHLCFQDDCLTVDREASLELFKMMEQFKFSCFGSTRIDHMDDEIAMAMARAGFYEVSFGIESGSQALLDLMHKDVNVEMAFYARDAVRRAGMRFTALMIQGFPGETDAMRRETEAFMNRLQPEGYGSLGHTMVLPGTHIYSECKSAGLINDDFWLGDEPYYIYRGGL